MFLENGAIAQLGERFNGIEEVVGSIPSGSTKFIKYLFLRLPIRKAKSYYQIATSSPLADQHLPHKLSVAWEETSKALRRRE
jgi:hypothetical protein